MMRGDVVIAIAAIVGVAAAARSTWSPCGLSMLSSITPFGERARGYRYGFTAAWFAGGAAIGGACLGVMCAVLSAAYGAALGPRHPAMTGVLAASACLAGAAVDAGVLGELLPLRRRQVNDQWLSRYRRWVYAGGFGWQIGSGVATYVMTSAVLTMAFLTSISGSPVGSIAVCATFGLVRGLAVLLSAGASTPERLRRLHRWMDRIREPVRWATIVVQVGAGLAAATIIGPVPVAVAAAATVATAGIKAWPVRVGRMPSR